MAGLHGLAGRHDSAKPREIIKTTPSQRGVMDDAGRPRGNGGTNLMATLIADTACVDPRADIADDVEIGPYCVIGKDVRIGRGNRLLSHVCIYGNTSIGEYNVISPFVVIGGDPQDVSYQGTPTRVEIGDHNIFRENVTINRATEKEDGVTRLGSHNFLFAGAHVAHDCKLADRITIANGTMLGGHVHVQSLPSLSGGLAVHHSETVGS